MNAALRFTTPPAPNYDGLLPEWIDALAANDTEPFIDGVEVTYIEVEEIDLV